MPSPVALEPALAKARERLSAHPVFAGLAARDSELSASLDRLLASSEYAADVLGRYPRSAGAIACARADASPLCRPLELDTLLLEEAPEGESEPQFMRRLRLFRHRELVRIIWRDSARWSDCEETLRELSAAADACLRGALMRSQAELGRRHGVPRDAHGEQVDFVIVAMGKLGGGELNFSSDVDLVFLYAGQGRKRTGRAFCPTKSFFGGSRSIS